MCNYNNYNIINDYLWLCRVIFVTCKAKLRSPCIGKYQEYHIIITFIMYMTCIGILRAVTNTRRFV